MTYADSCFYRKPEDNQLFEEWTKDIPPRTATTPYGCGPHSIRPFRMALELFKPASVLEIGFNLGHSAAIMLNLSVKHVTSVDIRNDSLIQLAVKVAQEKFGPRFRFLLRGEKDNFDDYKFDMVFIDGDHSQDGVMKDIKLARSLGIKQFFFDDWVECWGPGVKPAIEQAGLLPIAIFGNMACCVETEDYFRGNFYVT